MAYRTIIVGSPREDGRSAKIAQELFESFISEFPEDGASVVSVAGLDVSPCMGCDACKVLVDVDADEAWDEDDPMLAAGVVRESDSWRHICAIEDEMDAVRSHIDAATELHVVSPVYFSGPPAQLKCVMDRMQPYYWSDLRKVGKRPLHLHVVRDGDGPFGYSALESCVRSAFGVAGFTLEDVEDHVREDG